MLGLTEIMSILGWVVALLGLVVAALNVSRNISRDNERETQERASIAADLRHISDGVREVNGHVVVIDAKLNDHSTKLAAIEQDVRGLHDRVDKCESRVDTLEQQHFSNHPGGVKIGGTE